MFSSRESKGVGNFSFGGGLEGKLNFVLFFFRGGGAGGLGSSSGTMGNLGIYQERVIYSLLTIPTLTSVFTIWPTTAV